MLDNIEIAVLTKTNELATRCGLKVYDFVATFKFVESTDAYRLSFEIPAQGNALRESRFDKMLEAVGVNKEGFLEGSYAQIIDALDVALEKSDRHRPRF